MNFITSSPPNTGSAGPFRFETADGHNPEIIYHLLDGQRRLPHPLLYNDLDEFLRLTGPSPGQLDIWELEREEIYQDVTDELNPHRASTPASPEGQNASRLGAPSYSPQSSPPQSPIGPDGHDGREQPASASEYDTDNAESSDAAEWATSGDEDSANLPTERDLWSGAPHAANECHVYIDVLRRLLRRQSRDPAMDTDDILDRDYFNGVSAVYNPRVLVRYMRTKSGEKHTFSPGWDGPGDAPMPEGPFEVLCPNPEKLSPVLSEPMALRHIYLPGWRAQGRQPQEDKLKASEWRRGIQLAVGRWLQKPIWYPGCPPVSLAAAVSILGFPDLVTFQDFIFMPEIVDAFRELWDDYLQHVSSQVQLPYDEEGRRPIALRILYSRTRGDASEFDDEHPDKMGWQSSSHLARFCLQLEKVCNAQYLPPIRGQLPILRKKAATSIVAWAGIELARILRTLPKQPGNNVCYPDEGRRPLVATVNV